MKRSWSDHQASQGLPAWHHLCRAANGGLREQALSEGGDDRASRCRTPTSGWTHTDGCQRTTGSGNRTGRSGSHCGGGTLAGGSFSCVDRPCESSVSCKPCNRDKVIPVISHHLPDELVLPSGSAESASRLMASVTASVACTWATAFRFLLTASATVLHTARIRSECCSC